MIGGIGFHAFLARDTIAMNNMKLRVKKKNFQSEIMKSTRGKRQSNTILEANSLKYLQQDNTSKHKLN